MLNMHDVLSIIEKMHPGFKVYGPYPDTTGRKRIVFREMKNGFTIRKGKSFSMAWARAKMTALLGRFLSDDEEVDHRNTDHTDDSWDNLQILQRDAHRKKTGAEVSATRSKRKVLICPVCSNPFVCKRFRLRIANEKGKEPCCSRRCAIDLYGGQNQYS